MAERSKELLQLEHKGIPRSSLESALLVCNNKRESSTQTKKLPPDGTPLIAPVPQANENQSSRSYHIGDPTKTQILDCKISYLSMHDDIVLGKVKDFLGVMSEANKQLELNAKDHPENYDIEELTGNESKVIEMDLMLGVADLHTPEAVAAAESLISSCQPVIPLAADGSETDSDESSADDDNGDDETESSDDEHDYGNDGKRPSSLVERSISGKDKIHEKQKGNHRCKKRPRIVELS